MFSSLVRGCIGNIEQLLLNIDVLIPPQSLKNNYDKIRFLVKLRDVERQLN